MEGISKRTRLSLNKRKAANSVIVISDEESESPPNKFTVKTRKQKANEVAVKSATKIDKDIPLAEPIPKKIAPQVKRSLEESVSSPKKRNRTIYDWVNNPQKQKKVHCPACEILVLHAEINNHLDGPCNGGINEDKCCSPENINIPLKSKRKNSSVTQNNKKSIKPLKSFREMNLNEDDSLNSKTILSGKKESWYPSPKSRNKYATAPHGQNFISANKNTETMSVDILEDGMVELNNDLAKTILSDSDSDGKMNMKHQDLSEKMVNEKAKKSDDNGNDCLEVKDLSVNDALLSADMEKGCIIEDVKADGNDDIIINEEEQSDPYYLANFKLVLDTVLSNEEDRNLFNDVDQNVIKQFQAFPAATQKLYIRLFQRKPGWFRCSKLDYPKIAEDLSPVLKGLIKTRFLDNEKKLTDLKEALKLLSAGELKDLAKKLHVITKSTQQKGQNKQDIIDSLITHGESQKTLFGNGSTLLLKRAKESLGLCVCVLSDPKSVFLRLLLLFSMNIIPEDEDNKYNGQSQQLSTLMLVNMGKLVYPQYNIIRQVPIFKDREHMIKFAEAYQEKHDMSVALEVTRDLEIASSFYPKAARCFEDVLSTLEKKQETFSSRLPIHLRCFTAEWVYTRMCYLGVEVLQKKREYEKAVEQLKLLLQQDTYCADCRGLWWERLALNVHQHLKHPIQALQIVRQGLEDRHVRFGRRLALVQRGKKILSSASFKKKKKDDDDCGIDEALLIEPSPAESITISGKRSADLGVFISHEVTKSGRINEESKTFLGVEEYALSHYRQQGYDEGIHGETSTFTTLYGLFFWDILFLDGIPDVFRGKFQAAPLDIKYDTFYTQRKELLDQRLQEIGNCSNEDLAGLLEESWNEHEGQTCSGVAWQLFDNVQQAKQFVSCIGGQVLAGIFKHFAQDMRHWHSGMPDLVVWNSSTLHYRIVEVKGPGDRLSTKQELWLDELASFGATVEVCYVKAVGGKKLSRTQ